MSILSAAHLLAPTLPAHFAKAITALGKVYELKRDGHQPKAQRQEQAHTLYAEVRKALSDLEEPTPVEARRDTPEFRRWFAEAVLLWAELGKTGSTPLIDTVGARTLSDFPLDLPLDEASLAQLRGAVAVAMQLTAAEFAELENHIKHITSNLELKRRLTHALSNYAKQHHLLSDEGRVKLMNAFYRDVPWRPGDVDFAITSANIFFFVPRRGKRLERSDWQTRPEHEQSKVADFFSRLDRANVAETERFPAFGLYEPEHMDEAMLETLSAQLEVPTPVIQNTLATMFSVIPTRLRSQYLVHDTWGHTWQEAVSEFEWEYELLPLLSTPVLASTGPRITHDETKALANGFSTHRSAQGEITTFEPERFWQLVEADITARVRIGVSMALSEVLADFMEAKYSRVWPDKALPTSSLIRVDSLKLDLSIADLKRQMKRATKGYQVLLTEESAQKQFVQSLHDAGLPKAGSAAAAQEAFALLSQRLAPLLDNSFRIQTVAAGQISSTIFLRTLLQLVLLMTELERALEFENGAIPAWHNPGACADLFVIAFTHYYEQDRTRNFWHLDQIARTEFGPACESLRKALGT